VGKRQFKAHEEKNREPARFIQLDTFAFLQAEEKQLEQRTTQATCHPKSCFLFQKVAGFD
jgi:hypothetical protein